MNMPYGGGGARHNSNRQSSYSDDRYKPIVAISVGDITLAKPIPAELFSDIAQNKANAIRESGGSQTNKSTQLRKFYDELVMWHEKVHMERTADARSTKYVEIAPFIKMMKAKVAYAKGRGHVDDNFEKLFSHLISQITDVDSLKHAKLFMEAFMGFYKALGDK